MEDKLEPITEWPTLTLGKFKVIAYKQAVVVQAEKQILYEHGLFGAFRDIRGTWNPHLGCGPGWIFPGTRKQAVVDLILSKITDKKEIDAIPEFVFKAPVNPDSTKSRNYNEIDI